MIFSEILMGKRNQRTGEYGMITKKTLGIIGIMLLVMTAHLFAASVKENMRARLPEINELKKSGVIGENNQGFLELRSESNAAEALILEENNDRLLVYKKIAQQQKTTPELVGQRRALQIIDKAIPGTWLQDKPGSWYQK